MEIGFQKLEYDFNKPKNLSNNEFSGDGSILALNFN